MSIVQRNPVCVDCGLGRFSISNFISFRTSAGIRIGANWCLKCGHDYTKK